MHEASEQKSSGKFGMRRERKLNDCPDKRKRGTRQTVGALIMKGKRRGFL